MHGFMNGLFSALTGENMNGMKGMNGCGTCTPTSLTLYLLI